VSDGITLYDTLGSPCARRVRIVLLEKGQVSIESERYPNVSRWMAELSERPSLRRSESARPD